MHPTPLSIDDLADMFQEFYVRAGSHISTHIAALSSRLSRGKSPSPSEASQTSKTLKGGKAASGTSRKGADPELDGTEQQMLTASEISDRKRARRLLGVRHKALEEAVERAVCEKMYDRIWRHRITDDAERDEKLRSRTAALSLVGIGLKELVSTADDIPAEVRKATIEKEEDICNWLAGARESIRKMDEERYPVGKLQHLTAAHKNIVETLSRLFPSSSSADEILPTLIYTLITSPPESLNVVSNLKFIQRFRASRKVDGEAAYCLVNLEAAISFLETVDLSSLREDEAPEGPEKSTSRPSTPRSHTAPTPMNLGLSSPAPPSVSPLSATSGDRSPSTTTRPPASPLKPQRRISYLIQSQADRINEASDAVRASINDTADQALDSINTTLETSFKFLFGRLSESPTKNGASEVPVPRTLEDVRKLVGTPPPLPLDDDGPSAPEGVPEQTDGALDSSPAAPPSRPESKLTDLFAGRRDRSADSTRSGGSGKRVSFVEGKNPTVASSSPAPAPPPTPSPSPAVPAASSGNALQNLGNTLNPLKGFGGLGGFPRFGRAVPSTPTPPAVGGAGEKGKQLGHGEGKGGSPAGEAKPLPSASEAKEAGAVKALEELRRTGPPVKKFLEMKDAREIRIGEVEELLREYQRLAGALRAAIQS